MKKLKEYFKSKVFFALIFIALIAILIFLVAQQFSKTNSKVLELYTEHQTLFAEQVTLSLENYIKERYTALDVLSDFPASRNGDNEIFLIEYKRIYEKVAGFEYIIFVDDNVKPKYGYPSPYECPSQKSPKEWRRFLAAFNKAKTEKKTIIHTKNILINDKLYFCIISPVFSFDEEFLGAIVGVLDVKQSINHAIKPVVEDKSDYAWILNDEGSLIYHPKHDNMILNNVFSEDESCFDCHYNFDLERQIIKKNIKSGIKQHKKTEKQLITSNYLNIDAIGWYVIISSPLTKMTAAIDKLNSNIILLGGVVFFILLLGGIIILKIKTKEIRKTKELESIRKQASLIDEKNAAEAQYRFLIEQSNSPIFLCSKNSFLIVNNSFKEILKKYFVDFSIDKYSPKVIFNKILDDNSKADLNNFLLNHKKSLVLNTILIEKDHRDIEFLVSLRRFVFFRKVYYQVIAQDLTEIRRLEKEKQHQSKLALIGEMASQISHEIKNPLASIQTGMQLLENRLAKDEMQKEYFNRLKSEIVRIDGILKGLLAYAKYESLSLSKTTIQELLEHFTDIIQPTLEKNDLKMKTNVADERLPVLVDSSKIQQVLWNVFINSIQASKKNDVIEISTFKENGFCEIRIIDQGMGIDQDIIQKIFKPFYTTKKHGSGLGLAICKKILDQHHGEILLESKIGFGTTVKILLPIESQLT